MKKLIIYYSYTGKTAKMAKKLAEKRNSDLYELRDVKRPGVFKAYTAGCLAAVKGRSWAVEPIAVDLGEYDHITIMAPVWANNPAPEINNVFEALPSGKKVEIVMVSAGGKSGCEEKLAALLAAKDCTLAGFRDVRGKLADELDG